MYDWDENKSNINLSKHGISFAEAKEAIFEDKNILIARNEEKAEAKKAGI